jgi:hypothetical protein
MNSIHNSTSSAAIPEAMKIQLARLFGSLSKEAMAEKRTDTEWRKTLKSVLREIDRYIAQNVDTDELHLSMLLSGLASADESLKQETFWPGYAEGITRLVLTLLGDYPDHRGRKPGRKTEGHYRLDRFRTLHWIQTVDQRMNTLLAAYMVGFQKLSRPPREVLNDFRQQFGFAPGYREFLDWYRKTYPQDYAVLFR